MQGYTDRHCWMLATEFHVPKACFRVGQDARVVLDGKVYESRINGDYQALDTHGIYYLGMANYQ